MKIIIELDCSKKDWDSGIKTMKYESGEATDEELAQMILNLSSFVPHIDGKSTNIRFTVKKVTKE